MCNPAWFHHNGGNAGQEVRHSGLLARAIHILKFVLLQELHPMHLARLQMRLLMQVFKGGVFCDHSGALAVDVMAPLFKCNNNSQELTVICRVVALGTSELLAKIDHRLHATTLILLYGAATAIFKSISINSEVPTHVRYDQNRGSSECRTKGLKGLLLDGAPHPWHTGAQQFSQWGCNASITT